MECNEPSTSGVEPRKRKRYTTVTIQQKLEAIRKKDAGLSTLEIAKEYNVAETAVRKWIREREKLEKHCLLSTAKRIRPSPVEKVNQAVTLWFQDVRRSKNIIGVTQVKAIAQEFYARFGGTGTFKASDGWFQRWKERNGVRILAVCGEQLSANTEAVERFKTEIVKLMEDENLTLSQIFNADETGLMFKMLPSKTLVMSNEEEAPGFKRNQDRLTIMPCCNGDGSFKLPLLVIGKYKNPRALKNLAQHLLPVKYTSQQNAWMNGEIFQTWFRENFVPEVRNFLKQRSLPENAVLLVDNARPHTTGETLSVDGIKAVFLPPNVTSLVQPLDQGIIEAMKRRYKTKLLTYVINAQNDEGDYTSELNKFNIKNAIDIISESWDEISSVTIANCWKKLLSMTIETSDTTEITSEQIYDLSKKINGYENLTLEEVKQWIESNPEFYTDEEIVQAVEADNSEETAETEDESTDTEVSASEALRGINSAISFLQRNEEISISDLKVLKKARKKILRIKNNI